MKLLLHACCAPCSVQCVAQLRAEQLQPDLFWYNPNIHPFTEYRSRMQCLENFAQQEKLTFIAHGEYGLRPFLQAVQQQPDFRCTLCYRLRLRAAAEYAAAHGYDAFSTTLLISPYQQHELLRQTGEQQAEAFGVAFLYRDFRPFFREGQRAAREAGMYMQKYCGCIFSEEERYLTPKKK